MCMDQRVGRCCGLEFYKRNDGLNIHYVEFTSV